MKKNNQKGFTLIELLVVIAIIGLLSTMAVVSLNNARVKARDARRISDIKQIQTALEMYFTDNNDYPAAANATTVTLWDSSTGSQTEDTMEMLQDNGYMAAVPQNPSPNGVAYTYRVCTYDGGACGDDATVAAGERASYTLAFELEGGGGGMLGGHHCSTPAGMDTGAVVTGDVTAGLCAIEAIGAAGRVYTPVY